MTAHGTAAHGTDAPEAAPRTGSTRDRILDALVEVILAGGLPGFAVQEVADRAGVSHRTVYRHFPTRESLLEGLAEVVDHRMRARGGIAEPADLDEIPVAALANVALFARDARAVEASVRFGVGAAIVTRDHRRRTERFREVVAERAPASFSAADAVMAGGVIRQIVSSRTWLGLRESGLDAGDAARAVAWAAAVLVDAVHAGRSPSDEPAAPAAPDDDP